MILVRSILFNLGYWVWTACLGVAGLPLLLLPRAASVRLSEIWTGGILWWLRVSVGLRYVVRGRENLPAAPVIVAMKHQSAWETLALNHILGDPAIVYKRELNWLPLVGWYIHKAGMIAIDRKGGAAALKRMIVAARRVLADRRPIVIFPEGTRGPVGARLPYQPGVGALYAGLGLPLVPVALNSGLFWSRGAFTKRRGCITVEFLPTIPPGVPRRQAMAELEQRIEEATARLVAAPER